MCAHLILMTAVKAGLVKTQLENQGDAIYWWNNFYKLASSIEMGSRVWNIVLKFFNEARALGILGGSRAEMFLGNKVYSIEHEHVIINAG